MATNDRRKSGSKKGFQAWKIGLPLTVIGSILVVIVIPGLTFFLFFIKFIIETWQKYM